jgi:hypothetical protein
MRLSLDVTDTSIYQCHREKPRDLVPSQSDYFSSQSTHPPCILISYTVTIDEGQIHLTRGDMVALFREQGRLRKIRAARARAGRTHFRVPTPRGLTLLEQRLRITASASQLAWSECDSAADKIQPEGYSQRRGVAWRCAKPGKYLVMREYGAERFTCCLEELYISRGGWKWG